MQTRSWLAVSCLLAVFAAPVQAQTFIDPDPGPALDCFDEIARRGSRFDKGHSPDARPLTVADTELVSVLRGTALVEICLTTPDEAPLYAAYGDILYLYRHRQRDHCLALRLTENRLLALGTCFPDSTMREAGIRTGVLQARFDAVPSKTAPGKGVKVTPITSAILPFNGPAAVLQILDVDHDLPAGGILKETEAFPEPGQRAVLVFYASNGVLSVLDTDCRVVAQAASDNLPPGSFLNSCRGRFPPGGGLLLDAETYELLGVQTRGRGSPEMIATRASALLDALGIGHEALRPEE